MILKNSNKGNAMVWVVAGAVLLVVAGLIALPRLSRKSLYAEGAPCLVPNLPLVIHIHPELEILVDGARESLPPDIGIGGICERAIHTHDATGQIHVESQVARDYKFNDFFVVWGRPIVREGYDLEMTVDGVSSTEYGALLLKDKQKIVLRYTKKIKN
jgi:hypothetical protein